MYPKIQSIVPLSGQRLRVTFVTGLVKIYDCSPLLHEPPFDQLRDTTIFRNVQVDQGGYGIVWNDEIDLSESELWLHGIEENASQEKAA
ncbi:MAG: DUF2442 domain-containing protein [Candidatus Sumerlaeota bacterium]|nr:DUF2442 domain-containing protein [Candidatus Sumerlaeota bacterium]